MYKDASPPPLVLIAGPTASGKSSLAIALAGRIGGTILNADSAQVYRDLRVLSARPSAADEARVPHRLFGHVDGADRYSAAEWAAAAAAEIDTVHGQGRVPILVGGSGLYLRTLLDGIAPIPEIDPQLRAAVRALPVADAHAALGREDARSAARLRPTDTTRVARALEVVRATGRSIEDWRSERVGGIAGHVALRAALLLPDRDWLYARCDARFAAMLREGAIEEVAHLLERELSDDQPVMRAIGVREIRMALRGETSWEEAARVGMQATRRYAKRQFTWLAHQTPGAWSHVNNAETEADDILFQLGWLTP
jgi:tRNA dimethylallyltransferase